MECHKHTTMEAAGTCSNCGKPICKDCIIAKNQKYFCSNECLDEKSLFNKERDKNIFKEASTKAGFANMGFGLLLTFAVIAIFSFGFVFYSLGLEGKGAHFYVIGVPLMIASVVLFVVGLVWGRKRLKRKTDEYTQEIKTGKIELKQNKTIGGGAMIGMVWMFLISILLFWLPVLGAFIAGIIGGKKSGGIGSAFAAVFLPSIIFGIILFSIATSLSGIPMIGAIAGGGGFILSLAHIGPLLVGAVIGGALAK